MKYLVDDSAKHLNIKSVKYEKKYFAEGEVYFRILEDIRGEEIVFISSIMPNNFLDFLFLIDAIKNAGGKIKEIVVPFMSYARQDKIYSFGESISGKVICSVLANLKIPIRIFDIHSLRLKEYLKFSSESVLPYLLSFIPKKNFVVVSPDKGGLVRAEIISNILRSQLYFINKKRVGNKIYMEFLNNLSGQDVLIVDDMISTGETLVKAVNLLKKAGAGEIYCISAHGLFVKDAVNRIIKTDIKKIFVSNTLPLKSSKKIEVVDIRGIILKNGKRSQY